MAKGRKERTVFQKLRDADDAARGARLTPGEVATLMRDTGLQLQAERDDGHEAP